MVEYVKERYLVVLFPHDEEYLKEETRNKDMGQIEMERR